MKNEIIKVEPILTKQESEFYAWQGTIQRNPGHFQTAFALEAQGCPKYLIRAMLDIVMAKMELTKEQEDFMLEQARAERDEQNLIDEELESQIMFESANDLHDVLQVESELDEISDDVDRNEKFKLNVTPDEHEH